MFCMQDIEYIASVMGITFDKFSKEEFFDGMNLELEHGRIHKETNVTDDDPVLTARIVMAHLNEFPNYYNKEYGLRSFEEFLKTKLDK